jgi:hypothetical protein
MDVAPLSLHEGVPNGGQGQVNDMDEGLLISEALPPRLECPRF